MVRYKKRVIIKAGLNMVHGKNIMKVDNYIGKANIKTCSKKKVYGKNTIKQGN